MKNKICLGVCVEAGDDERGTPQIDNNVTRKDLAALSKNIVEQRVAVVHADDVELAEVFGFDSKERTITLRFNQLPAATLGDYWAVITKETP